ncbi:hypothetical protein H072_517 [Dactylellina haptotyla CBS 200.50]|uniref:Copper transport protein n=1 Tax=Dactylellina haptotyla (strain CBS 200.50) TaxID=1284197 RepID=S8C157_DACHA|nr:hypothetical protein H072_517 [Dactylellina haptotyla CBS 200.50]
MDDMPGMTGMTGMDDTSGTSTSTIHSSHGGMAMVFQSIIETPIYSYAFTPKNPGQYFGALVFLALLSFIHRGLIAYASHKELIWRERESTRKIVIAKPSNASDKTVVNDKIKGPAPWRWTVDPVRALLSGVNIGLQLLLMLAVMTLNVGYFLAVIVGVFLGDLTFARFAN